ncbi:sugar transferase [Vagococcus hydrophili]|uniref:Sugar transferase n=1 Tax=Vagococcus hydrophili TaxID=2714947 RepID=A0A6G8AQR9_9ENTE|nr:sugar transferase [Vagococcus hydrophili]QIL47428.1 sugar transferase [Vagococcus hydrophili]
MYQTYIKRILDILISFIGIGILFLVMIPVSIVIKKEDQGPIFFNGKRLGKNMKEFKMYKFRTMKTGAPDLRNSDGTTYNSASDQRVTNVGHTLRKLSVDELPQFINVLKGDMSIIGPRPSPLGNKDMYPKKFFKKYEVKPGITGYNQALLRNSATMDERIENDAYYTDNISFFLDVKIFYWTLKSVIRRKNINNH